MLWPAGRGRPSRTLALLAFWIPLPLPLSRSAPRTDPAGWRQLLEGFSSRGVLVRTSHPRCGERDLYGLYVRGRREVVVCPRGDRSLTLRHEGWHLVQSLCLSGTPWLPAASLETRLSRTDRRELQLLIRPEQRQREAEARLMAQLAPASYLEALDQACNGPLPSGQAGEPLRWWKRQDSTPRKHPSSSDCHGDDPPVPQRQLPGRAHVFGRAVQPVSAGDSRLDIHVAPCAPRTGPDGRQLICGRGNRGVDAAPRQERAAGPSGGLEGVTRFTRCQ